MSRVTEAYTAMCDTMQDGELTLGAALWLVVEDYDLSLTEQQELMRMYRREHE